MDPKPALFPVDEFADDRWQADTRESAAARLHDHTFLIVLPTHKDAVTLVDRLRREGVTADIGAYSGDTDFPWPVAVTASMRPWGVTHFAHHLGALAGLLGGKLVDDGRPATPQGVLF